jgi:SAM-dependent methyltransferase
MLGGFSALHIPDIRHSRIFLEQNLSQDYPKRLALGRFLVLWCNFSDVGAGIGRVSTHLLLPIFERVSIVESDPRFVKLAQQTLQDRLHVAHNCRLQDYRCEQPEQYDLVWIQWVLMYASDEELTSLLMECVKSVRKGGFIGIKENTLAINREPDVDLSDHSIVRSDEHFRRIFDAAGLELVNYALQSNFPTGVYPVRMYLLRAK